MKSISIGEDMSELLPNPRKRAGMCSTAECSAFSLTLRGEAAFPFPPLSRVPCSSPFSREGQEGAWSLWGGPHSAAKVRDKGAEGFSLRKFPLPTTSSLPWGLGRGKQVLTVPAVLGAPGQERRDWRQEEGVVLDKLQVRGERGLGPTWKRCQGRGEAFPYVRETPVLWDLCLLPHRGYVCPLE